MRVPEVYILSMAKMVGLHRSNQRPADFIKHNIRTYKKHVRVA